MNLVTSSGLRRRLGVGALAVGCALMVASAAVSTPEDPLDPLDPLAQPAALHRRAAASMLIAATRAGDQLVAAGESGIVLTSADAGGTWKQAKVPVSVTITSLAFSSAKKGWAAGHSGVILASEDGGQTWVRQLDGRQLAKMLGGKAIPALGGAAPQGAGAAPTISGDPFLDIFFTDESNGFAVGAFGLIVRTRDGGRSWLPWQSHLRNPEGNHLYGIRAVGSDLFVVGERGSIYVSDDGGETFKTLKSPYEGSFFGLTATPDGGVLVYGMRGHVFLSKDRGQSWAEIKVGSGSAWLGTAVLPGRGIVLVSQAGEVAQSNDGGASFTVLPSRQPPLTAVVGTSSGLAVTVGVRGTGRVELPAIKSGA